MTSLGVSKNPPSDAFLSRIERVLINNDVEDISMASVLAYLQIDGRLSNLSRERIEDNNLDMGGPDEEAILSDFFNLWMKVTATDMVFVGGILDMRLLRTCTEDLQDNPTRLHVYECF